MELARQSNSQESASRGDQKSFAVSSPAITLPKGGGAIRGIGEKFAANPVTGTGSMSIPIATSPGRSGFGPQLNLSYDSGSGNGPFGFGWSLSIPAITRKTDKGLPRYFDAIESDVFILSGAEDLVPTLVISGTQWVKEPVPAQTINNQTYDIQRYRPRIEGLFTRIERWTNQTDKTDSFWRSISKDNITTWYGKTIESRITDPNDRSHIFSWLICQSYDDKGNAIIYDYQSEDSQRIFEDQQGKLIALAHERNRNEASRSPNRYLKRIKYGNRTPNREAATGQATDPALLPNDTWMFEVVFDYGEGHYMEDALDAQGRVFAQAQISPPARSHWPVRQDPFSTYHAGFEVRTYRLCRGVLMFHHFPQELGITDCLVHSTEFSCTESPLASFITSVTQSGYIRQPTQNTANRYLKKSLPPVEFEYSQVPLQNKLAQQPIREIDAESLENLPAGLDGASYQWMDLDGEGTYGILTEQADGWYYKRNLSANNQVSEDGHEHTVAQFGPIEVVARKPVGGLSSGAQFLDLAGDGQVDLVQMEGPVRGFYERTTDENWERFQPFISWPNLNTHDPNLKFVDLTGDGHADILITEDDVFVWHPSFAEDGFGPAEKTRQSFDEEKGPRLVFDDGTQSIYLADLSGDGLSDLVRIRNGEVCYWPNLGYGLFGAKVTMDGAPWFDSPDQFDQKRIRLADTDGSGTTDILYLRRDGVQIYFNQSGNRWSDAVALPQFPPIDNISAVQVLDLLGNGTACLVWSSPLPGNTRRPMRYLTLMEEKPHLLIGVTNNLGAETKVHYAPSTKFYLKDKQNGKPWITRLPFPVHVVERVETYDRISGNRFVSRNAYHHGYFDGIEREFRGFGMVEQWDTEEFAALSAVQQFPVGTNIEESSHVPPVLTRTWFHTGIYLGRDRVSNFFAGLLDVNDKGVYYREPGLTDVQAIQLLLDDTLLPGDLTFEEEREACRALKGSMLRQEVYALDGTTKQDHPYTATEQNFTIERLQPHLNNRHAVFFTHACEAIAYHYERNPADPRITHALTLEVDKFGNVLKEAAIGYGRRKGQSLLQGADKNMQEQTLITYTENDVTNSIDDPTIYPHDHRTPLPCETRTYEITGLNLPAGHNRFTFEDVLNAGTGAVPIPYEQSPLSGIQQKRLIENIRTLYRHNNLTSALLLGELQSLALPFESYKLALTPTLLTGVFGGWVTNSMLDTEGRYVHSEGDTNWWIPSGRMFYSSNPAHTPLQELTYARAHFFLPHRYRDPFHTNAVSTESFVTYDAYNLLVLETRDALSNQVTVGERFPGGAIDPTKRGNDYRVLQPWRVMDPNRNRTQVAFDTLGLVVATAVMGEPGENKGDNLINFEADLTQTQIDTFHDALDPHILAAALLKDASTRIIYDLHRFQRSQQAYPTDSTQWEPPYAATLARETHASDPLPAQGLKIQISFSYSDGFGREIQKKIQAEPGEVEVEDAAGNITVVNTTPNLRWVGSGWTIFNNKGKPVRQYEPFFSTHHKFQFGKKVGVSPILFYDPVERVVVTLHPNHTWEKVVFDPWRQETWDVNDTVLVADPKNDLDVGDFFSRLPNADYLPTWYAQRQSGALGTQEQAAARKAAIHAATPTVAYADSLGRTFLTVAHNKFKYSDAPPAALPSEEFHRTRINLDIEGNQREVMDERKNGLGNLEQRVVMRYDYDILGSRIHQGSMEAGARWMLANVAGKPIRAWDDRNFVRRITYDALQRPIGLYVTEPAGERLAEQTIYGEGKPSPEATNHRGKAWQVRDDAGIVTSEAYDFKGNLKSSKRDLRTEYKTPVNWAQQPAPATPETFTSSSSFDALNRVVEGVAPDGSVTRPRYNEANLLEAVEVRLHGAAQLRPFVTNINYDAKGQRELIAYGNGALTAYEYDPLTFHLTKLTTTRPATPDATASQLFKNEALVQDLRYTYDPAGNITRIEDAALMAITHNNEQVEPVCEYTYDALYRLIEAKGREHIGQTANDFNPPDGNRRDYPFLGSRAQPNNAQAMRNYIERYEYDAVGNFEIMRHIATGGSWTRGYEYAEASLTEPAKQSNRLTKTTVGNGFTFVETYTYTDALGDDVHGCMTAINSMKMRWDFEDQLTEVDLQGGGTAYYIYDAGGERVRKVIERNGATVEERICLGGYELYRKRHGGARQLERQTLHVMDDKQRIALVETRTIDLAGNDPAPPQLIRYQLGNHLDSASLELDDQAQIISYEEYTPYGSTSYQAVRRQTETPKRYRYTGKERDEETGFSYHGARYYTPWLGRWVSCDPAGLIDGPNLFSFVKCNPEILIDPSGREGEKPSGIRWPWQKPKPTPTPVEKPAPGYRWPEPKPPGWEPSKPNLYPDQGHFPKPEPRPKPEPLPPAPPVPEPSPPKPSQEPDTFPDRRRRQDPSPFKEPPPKTVPTPAPVPAPVPADPTQTPAFPPGKQYLPDQAPAPTPAPAPKTPGVEAPPDIKSEPHVNIPIKTIPSIVALAKILWDIYKPHIGIPPVSTPTPQTSQQKAVADATANTTVGAILLGIGAAVWLSPINPLN